MNAHEEEYRGFSKPKGYRIEVAVAVPRLKEEAYGAERWAGQLAWCWIGQVTQIGHAVETQQTLEYEGGDAVRVVPAW